MRLWEFIRGSAELNPQRSGKRTLPRENGVEMRLERGIELKGYS